MSKILFIGLDAADWELLSAKVASGTLPHLARLIEEGTSGPLRSLYPLFSPSLWATMATGKRAHEHGITGFTLPDDSGIGLRPYNSTSRRSPAIWNMLSHSKKISNVVGWWTTAPAEAIDGVMIDETFRIARRPVNEPWNVAPKSVSPESHAETVANERVHPQKLSEALIRFLVPKLYEIDPSTDFRIAAIAKILAEDLTTLQTALRLMVQAPWDFTTLYLVGLDSLSHLAMRYRDPAFAGEDARDCELYGNVVDRAYELYDRWIGQLLDAVDEKTTIVVASDHGFYHDARKPSSLGIQETAPAIQHAPIGTLIMKGPSLRKRATLAHASILDLCPTLLALLDLPIGRDMPGNVLVKAFLHAPILKKISSWNHCWQAPMSAATPSPEATEAALRQLISLGYLQEIPTNKQTAIQEAQCNQFLHRALSFLSEERLDQALPLLEKARVISQQGKPFCARTDILSELANAYLLLGEKRRAATFFYRLVRCRRRDAREAAQEFWKKAAAASSAPLSFSEAWEVRRLMARANLNEEAMQFTLALARFLAHSKEHDLSLLFSYAEKNPHDSFANLSAGALALQAARCSGTGASDTHAWEEKGIAALEHVAAFAREEAEPLAHLAEHYHQTSRFKKAEECARTALDRNPLHAASWLALATALTHQSAWEAAWEAAQQAKRSILKRSNAYALLAIIAREGKKEPNRARRYQAMAARSEIFLKKIAHSSFFSETKISTLEKKVSENFSQSSPEKKPTKKKNLSAKNADPSFLEIERFKKNYSRCSARNEEHSTGVYSDTRGHEHRSDAAMRCYSFFENALETPIIVTGLPRSGTSLLMQMLSAGGIPVDTDHQRSADEHNPRGYFEQEKVKNIACDPHFLKAGMATKIVIPLSFHLPLQKRYHVLWIQRDLEEVITSQERMAGLSATRAELEEVYRHYEQRTATFFQHAAWPLLTLKHASIFEDPKKTAHAIADFLQKDLAIEAMVASVIPNLHRVRAPRRSS